LHAHDYYLPPRLCLIAEKAHHTVPAPIDKERAGQLEYSLNESSIPTSLPLGCQLGSVQVVGDSPYRKPSVC
jgi:hypothetical protein